MKKIVGELTKITRYRREKAGNISTNSVEYATQLNHFHARFDCHDFNHERKGVINTLNGEDGYGIPVSEGDALGVFKTINPDKAAGPDSV